jgi:hypothetical protein
MSWRNWELLTFMHSMYVCMYVCMYFISELNKIIPICTFLSSIQVHTYHFLLHKQFPTTGRVVAVFWNEERKGETYELNASFSKFKMSWVSLSKYWSTFVLLRRSYIYTMKMTLLRLYYAQTCPLEKTNLFFEGGIGGQCRYNMYVETK